MKNKLHIKKVIDLNIHDIIYNIQNQFSKKVNHTFKTLFCKLHLQIKYQYNSEIIEIFTNIQLRKS